MPQFEKSFRMEFFMPQFDKIVQNGKYIAFKTEAEKENFIAEQLVKIAYG